MTNQEEGDSEQGEDDAGDASELGHRHQVPIADGGNDGGAEEYGVRVRPQHLIPALGPIQQVALVDELVAVSGPDEEDEVVEVLLSYAVEGLAADHSVG